MLKPTLLATTYSRCHSWIFSLSHGRTFKYDARVTYPGGAITLEAHRTYQAQIRNNTPGGGGARPTRLGCQQSVERRHLPLTRAEGPNRGIPGQAGLKCEFETHQTYKVCTASPVSEFWGSSLKPSTRGTPRKTILTIPRGIDSATTRRKRHPGPRCALGLFGDLEAAGPLP